MKVDLEHDVLCLCTAYPIEMGRLEFCISVSNACCNPTYRVLPHTLISSSILYYWINPLCLVPGINSYGTVYPLVQIAYTHDTATIKCYSMHKVKWTIENRKKTFRTKSGNTVILKKLKENDNGYYICHGTLDEEGQMFHARALLLVGGMFQIITSKM